MDMSRCGPRLLRSLGWLAVTAGFCLAQNFQEFATPGFSPYSIAAGPDGALWFTGVSGTVGRMTTAGDFSQYSLPANGFPQPIVAAADRALWAQVGTNQVARINTAGAVVDNSVNDGALVWSMTSGPDSAIWLTDGGIGRLSTTGIFTQFSTGNYAAFGITTGADGNLWFSASDFTSGGGVIGRMTTSGAVAAFPLASGLVVKAGSIATGADGAVWFAAEALGGGQSSIGRITTTGNITMFGIPNSFFYSFPAPSIAAGREGALWFTGNGALGRITTNGNVTVYPFEGQGNQIVAGSDGGMWFTDPSNRTLWRVAATAPPPSPPSISQINPSTIAVNSPMTGLRILGSGLQGDSSGQCSTAPESVAWNNINALNIGQVSPTEIDVTVPASLLATPGNFPVAVTVTQIYSGSCQTVTATSIVHVVPSTTGILGVTAGSLSFAVSTGTLPTPQTIGVTSTVGTLAYSVAVDYTSPAPGNWVGISSAGGSTTPDNPGSLTISVTNVAENFSPGIYTAAVTMTSGVQVQTVTVTLTVGTALNVQSVMVFGAIAGTSVPSSPQDPQSLLVGAVGSPVPFTYTITPEITPGGPSTCANSSVAPPSRESSGWLIINGSPNFGSGTTGQYLSVSVQPAGLVPGTYVDTISFFAQGSFSTTQVYLVVQSTQTSFNFSYTTGGAAPAPLTTQALTTSCGISTLNLALGYVSDQNWLNAVLNVEGGEFFATMTAIPYGLAPGTYSGTVAITDTAGEVWAFLCTLTVGTPPTTVTALSASPNPAISGQPVTLIAAITPPVATGAIIFRDNGNFLGIANLSGGAATIGLSFAPGNHTLTATYPGNAPYATSTSTPVNLQVNPALAVTTTSLAAVPSSQTFGNAVTLSATVTPSTATGTVMFLDGSTQVGSAVLSGGVATVSISTLAVGNHILTASYGGDAGDAPSVSSPFLVNITEGLPPVHPAILPGGIVNAASFASVNGVGSPVAPGSLVAIFTSTLATQGASFTTASLPGSLAGVSVTFKGITAPVVQVVPGGANPFVSVQVPFEVLTAGQNTADVPVTITVNGVPSAAAPVQIVASQPGIFTLTANGQGQAVLVNLADYTIAAPTGPGAHPIPRGQTAFFYVTGLGAMTPSVADGSRICPAANGLCNANAMPTVSVGGVPAQVSFAGQAPGFPGVGQINITIPQNAPTGGSVALTVTSADGTVVSNSASIAVQ